MAGRGPSERRSAPLLKSCAVYQKQQPQLHPASLLCTRLLFSCCEVNLSQMLWLGMPSRGIGFFAAEAARRRTRDRGPRAAERGTRERRDAERGTRTRAAGRAARGTAIKPEIPQTRKP